MGHGPTRTPSPLAGFWRCCVKRRSVRPQDMCRSRLMLMMVRNVPMPMRVGDDLPAGRRVRSWPGTCRCRRRSTPGTGPLGPTNRWSLLKWSDIHWDAERFTVTSPKTKRYGKASRVVPIFPELRPFIDEAFSMADEGENWVVPMLSGDADRNLGTTFRKIIGRAGVEVWPKPFQNCRSSRQTELEQKYPTYVVCAWLGNTPTIAHKHYLTVTDDHFGDAVKTGDANACRASQRLAQETSKLA